MAIEELQVGFPKKRNTKKRKPGEIRAFLCQNQTTIINQQPKLRSIPIPHSPNLYDVFR